MLDWILLIAAVVITTTGLLWRKHITAKIKAETAPDKKLKSAKKRSTIIVVIGIYLFATRVMSLVFGAPEKPEFEMSMFPPRVDFLGLNLSTTIIYTWYIMAFIIIVALILRFTVIRHMKDRPSGLQNVLELSVEAVKNYTHSTAHKLGNGMSDYIFTIAVYMICCAGLELFGLRTPTADATLTFALAIITFILINVLGFSKKGIVGRFKQLASPSPAILPIRLVTDLAVPVSLAFRLFGNMLGGMIVMDLLYSALGHNAIGIPSVLGLYFNVFHPLIQAYIFITLTLTFINEAIE